LSMAPLVILAVASAGIVLGRGTAHAEVNRLLNDTVGPKGASVIDQWVVQAAEGGKVASAVGIGLMLFAASKLGTRLREVLNQVWDVDADALIPDIKTLVRRRILSFALVIAAGPILLIIFASRTLLTAFPSVLPGAAPWVVQVLQLALSLFTVAGISAMVFRHVPDTQMSWRSIWIGSALTSVIFNLGNAVVGVYLGRAGVAAPYGAAGSVLVVLLWLYFSAHMFLVGAEFTQVYAGRHAGEHEA
jgi:membrane protein